MKRSSKLKWFYVAADYESVHRGKNEKKHLWERRVFVYRATEAAAEKEGLSLARSQEHSYRNGEGTLIQVKFRGIESYSQLFDVRIISGTEVYWDFSWKSTKSKVVKKKVVAKK